MGKMIFEVEISNKSPKGYETATVLKMPATWAEFQDALEKARIKDARDCHNELTRIEYPGIQRGMIGDNVNLYELNLLAQRLTMLSEDDRMGLDGLLQIEGRQHIGPMLKRVGAASLDECSLRCVECLIPSLRDTVDDTLNDADGLDQINEFAHCLTQKRRTWDEADRIKYKALLEASGHPDLPEAIQLTHDLDQYELRPEIAEPWDYTEVILREKYPDLPEELFQTPQAARIGQRLLEEGSAAITNYGLLRRKDGGSLPRFQPEQERFSTEGQHPEMGGIRL